MEPFYRSWQDQTKEGKKSRLCNSSSKPEMNMGFQFSRGSLVKLSSTVGTFLMLNPSTSTLDQDSCLSVTTDWIDPIKVHSMMNEGVKVKKEIEETHIPVTSWLSTLSNRRSVQQRAGESFLPSRSPSPSLLVEKKPKIEDLDLPQEPPKMCTMCKRNFGDDFTLWAHEKACVQGVIIRRRMRQGYSKASLASQTAAATGVVPSPSQTASLSPSSNKRRSVQQRAGESFLPSRSPSPSLLVEKKPKIEDLDLPQEPTKICPLCQKTFASLRNMRAHRLVCRQNH